MLGFHSISEFPISTIDTGVVPPPTPTPVLTDVAVQEEEGGSYHKKESYAAKRRMELLRQDEQEWLGIIEIFLKNKN